MGAPRDSLLASVLESPEDIGIFSLDRDYRYTAFNSFHRRTMKRIWRRDIALGQCMLDVIGDPSDRARAQANFDRVLSGERFGLTEEYGEPPHRFVYEDLYNPIVTESGEVIGLTVFLTDITEKTQAQQQLRRYHGQLEALVEERTRELQEAYDRLEAESRELRRTQHLLERSQRLESLGTLAGGVAHDFNNLLTVVLGYSGALTRYVPEDSPGGGYLAKIHLACRHASDLTSRLLAFSRRQVLQSSWLDPAEVLSETVDFLEHVLPNTVLDIDVPGTLPTVRADRGQLDQVLLNLAINARDAMDGRGRLRIAGRWVEAAAVPAERRDQFPRGAVEIAVSDEGAGIPLSVQGRIFDPFFTTKGVGKGSGLGLSMVYGIVEQHGGTLDVKSEVGVGTTFIIRLPAHDRPADTRPASGVILLDDAGRGRRVLVVDDEDEVREMVGRLLEDAGFDVVLARDAPEAMERFEEGHIDALFSDVMLPEVDGLSLALTLLERRPELPVLLASGYAETIANPERLLGLPRYRFLGKPYEPSVMIQALVELLAQPLSAPGET
ncbi:MAG: ATP-binding protein [Sandaracinaceae bacterium]